MSVKFGHKFVISDVMMSNSLLNYFGRSQEEKKEEKRKAEEQSDGKIVTAKSRPSVSLKTVLKWQKELNMTIGYKIEDHSVTEVWCAVCKEFAVEYSACKSQSDRLQLI